MKVSKHIDIINSLFMIVIGLMVLLPITFINWNGGEISEAENRFLSSMPSVKNEDGTWNTSFVRDFEAWIDDNIGFREEMVSLNNKIAFYIFQQLDNSIYDMLGPKGELNFTPDYILDDYHHLNLLKEEELNDIVAAQQYVKDYLKGKGIQYYKVQCWDKQTIYPEQFPRYILQYGDISVTDQVVQAINEETDVEQPDIKEALLTEKKYHAVFPTWGDAGHWNQRGAFVGYTEIMHTINMSNDNRYTVLKEEDFEIKMEDTGATLPGNIHKEDISEIFYLIDSTNPVRTQEQLTLFGEDERSIFMRNENVDNNTTLLILGDSYVSNFLVDYFAESFQEVIFIQSVHIPQLEEMINEYQPDIVLYENAERVFAAYWTMVGTVKEMKANTR